MTATQVLVELLNLGIVHKIGDEYFITTNVDKILNKTQIESNLTIPIVEVDISNLYPETIREANIDVKLKAVLDYCEVPAIITNDTGGRFMVRSNDSATRTAMLKILKNSNYVPAVVLEVIKDYYQKIPYPKAAKRFLVEGDFESLYDYYNSGKKLDSTDKPDNTNWCG